MKIKGVLSKSSAVWKVCQFLLVMLLTTILAIFLWSALFHGSQSLVSLKVLQMLQTIATFMLPCFIMAYLWSDAPMSYLSLDKKPDGKAVFGVILLMIIATPCINLMGYLNAKIQLPAFLQGLEELMKSQELAAEQLTERFLQADNIWVLLFNLLLMAVLPALSEELCFRGVLMKIFGEKGKIQLAIWASAIIFSAIHFQFYGFIPRMLMGVLFGYLLYWSGSLWLPVVAHFTNNVFAVVTYYIVSRYFADSVGSIDTFGTGSTLWAGILSAVLTVAGICLLYRWLKLKKAEF
ncbi:MAG: CPBP family intramembrane metalloprotease [Bacteroidales bacterium]|nr:CPBP family intramembrane metalloprotease [Bacteroidales bacterium]